MIGKKLKNFKNFCFIALWLLENENQKFLSVMKDSLNPLLPPQKKIMRKKAKQNYIKFWSNCPCASRK